MKRSVCDGRYAVSETHATRSWAAVRATSREAEVVRLIATGLSNDEIAQRLVIRYPPVSARRLRNSGHDVVAVLGVEVGVASRSDDAVLAWAARNS